MGKHEHPPFRMVIEGGKLVPMTAFDAERLDSYRRGTEVRVTFTEEKDRPLVRKWWAILGLVVKECNVPWQNKDQASEAIKLALGIVNLSKTVHGQYMQYPKSLTELTEPELEEAVEQMMALIQRMTGIDPETLKKEAQIDDHHSSVSPTDDSAAASDPASQPQEDAAATLYAADTGGDEDGEGDAFETAHGETVAPSPSAPSERTTRDCLNAFLRTATDEELTVIERPQTLETMKDWWKAELPSNLDFVRQCLQKADKVAKGELKAEGARKYLEGLL